MSQTHDGLGRHSGVSLLAGLPVPLQKYICAATAASIAETVTMPLDVCKTRMQLDLTPLQKGGAAAIDAPSAPPAPVRRGLLATGQHILQTEGFSRLYLGLTPAVFRQAIVGGIGVGLYPQIKDAWVHIAGAQGRGESYPAAMRSFLSSETPAPAAPLSFGTKVLIGATSGVIGQVFAAPMCVVKVRLQADARLPVPRYAGLLDALMVIPRQEGWRALFRGIVPSLQRAAVMYGATISTYDECKHKLVKSLYPGDPKAMDYVSTHVMASSVSGLVASVVSTPFDTIKTRIISQPVIPRKPILGLQPSGSAPLATTGVLYSSTIDCVVKTVRHEGFLAIYKGLLPCYARLAPWQLTFFVAFEQLSIGMTGSSLR